jgi:hypothetical protein
MDLRASLSLTCLTPMTPTAPPPVEAFTSGARTRDPEGDDLIAWLLPSGGEAAGLTCRVRSGALPSPAELAALPDLELWALPDPSWKTGWRSSPAMRTLVSLAAAVPLVLAPMTALAGDEAEPTEEVEVVEEVVEVEVAVGPVDDLSTTGDLLWTAMQGSQVELALLDGTKLFGRILTQSDREIALILDQDGFVMRVPKETIMRIRVRAMPDGILVGPEAEARAVQRAIDEEKPPIDGKPLAIVGTILTATGGAMLTTFAIGSAIDSSFGYYTWPMLILAPNLLGPGIPMMIDGFVKQKKYEEWAKNNAPVEVGMAPTIGGWSGSLTVRF